MQDASWLILDLLLALETLWAKRGGPFKQLAFAGRGREGADTLTAALGPAPGGGVAQRASSTNAAACPVFLLMLLNIRALTSPCLGSVSVKLR